MSAAIYYHPEAYTTSGPRLMGRNAAGESFLRGFLSYAGDTRFWAQVDAAEHAAAFTESVARWRPGATAQTCSRQNLQALRQPGAIFIPGPGVGGNAWQRAAFGHASWSLCGITHTTSSARAMDAIAELLVAPVQPWDALICTSTAVRDNVGRVLDAQAGYLAERLGACRSVLPQLPVIPLGIHCEDFRCEEAARAKARATLGADHRTHVVLFMGRLSFHAKAHPLAMYQALQRALERLPDGERVLLVECGWHANEQIAGAFAEAARSASPGLRTVQLDGRKPEHRQLAWAAADVFCSLSDNIQETFGITPIEAMAAGLPVVVSDWDGYRDTVRDGVDGFCIPTTMPQAGQGEDLALRHALEVDNYDMYCGLTCMLVAVDIGAAAEAFSRLFTDRELRQRMGAAGRERARNEYDWSRIIPRYESLWQELAERRAGAARSPQQVSRVWPARLDPFLAFSAYPTRALSPDTRLALAATGSPGETPWQRFARLRALAMVDFGRSVLPGDEAVRAVLDALAAGPQTAARLAQQMPEQVRARGLRALAALCKLGLLVRVDSGLEIPPPDHRDPA